MKAIAESFTEAKIIGTAVAKSALPSYILYRIWKGAVSDLKVLKDAKNLLG